MLRSVVVLIGAKCVGVWLLSVTFSGDLGSHSERMIMVFNDLVLIFVVLPIVSIGNNNVILTKLIVKIWGKKTF